MPTPLWSPFSQWCPLSTKTIARRTSSGVDGSNTCMLGKSSASSSSWCHCGSNDSCNDASLRIKFVDKPSASEETPFHPSGTDARTDATSDAELAFVCVITSASRDTTASAAS